MQFLLKGFAQLLGNRLRTLNFSYTWHTNRSIMGSAQSWGNKFLSTTNSCPQPQLSLPWVCVRERFVTDLCFSAKLLFPATAIYPNTGADGGEMKEHPWYLYITVFPLMSPCGVGAGSLGEGLSCPIKICSAE